MVPYLSDALYGGRIVFGGDPINRLAVVNFNIPTCTRKVPYTLVHCKGPGVQDHGKSLTNSEQEDTAISIYEMLQFLDPNKRVAIVCFYTGSQKALVERLPAANSDGLLEVNTVHSYIGNEADYVIIVTTRTKFGYDSEVEFVHQPKITTVALTRPKEACWLLGDMDFCSMVASQRQNNLSKLSRFVRDLAIDSPPLDGPTYKGFLNRITQNTAGYEYTNQPHLLLKVDNADVSLVADTKLGNSLGWLSGSFEPISSQNK